MRFDIPVACRKAVLLAVASFLLSFGSTAVWAEQGIADPLSALQDVELGDIRPIVSLERARYQTGGVALRNLDMGSITISGIPPGSAIRGAALYWSYTGLDDPISGVHDKIQIRRLRPSPVGGNVTVTGALVGMGPDPCWSGGSVWVYRAVVTNVVTGAGVYLITLMPGATGSIAGEDPWLSSPPPHAEGASMVVVYTNDIEPMGTVLLYDVGLAGATFSGTLTYNLVSPVDGLAVRWDMGGEDGQIGASVSPVLNLAGEIGFLNATQVYGPGSPINDSFWNGSDGDPLPQLQDTHGVAIEERIGPNIPIAVMHNSFGDCLTPDYNVLLVMPPG